MIKYVNNSIFTEKCQGMHISDNKVRAKYLTDSGPAPGMISTPKHTRMINSDIDNKYKASQIVLYLLFIIKRVFGKGFILLSL
jgi:hypothetical protein